jgi:hypothetical protein
MRDSAALFVFVTLSGQTVEIPIDSGIALSITIDKFRVFINKTVSTESLINQVRDDPVLLSSVVAYCCTYREDVGKRLPFCEGWVDFICQVPYFIWNQLLIL